MTEKSNDLKELFDYMNKAQDVHHWNELRDNAKEVFEQSCINELDHSGYIKKVLHK